MNHLIHALVKNMILSYEDHHKQQKLEMQGPNLAKKHQKDILTCAPKTSQELIQQINQSCFEVQLSSSEKTYEINLLTYIYTCLDFPCIQLYKHIMTTMHFFGEGD